MIHFAGKQASKQTNLPSVLAGHGSIDLTGILHHWPQLAHWRVEVQIRSTSVHKEK
jgi:hypothetical protein